MFFDGWVLTGQRIVEIEVHSAAAVCMTHHHLVQVNVIRKRGQRLARFARRAQCQS